MVTVETLVEARIVEIKLNQANGNVELGMLSADGLKHVRLVAEGVDDFRADELRINSITDDIFVYSADDADGPELVADLCHLLGINNTCGIGGVPVFVQKRIDSIRDGEFAFWVLHPVLGGRISILAKKISIYGG